MIRLWDEPFCHRVADVFLTNQGLIMLGIVTLLQEEVTYYWLDDGKTYI